MPEPDPDEIFTIAYSRARSMGLQASDAEDVAQSTLIAVRTKYGPSLPEAEQQKLASVISANLSRNLKRHLARTREAHQKMGTDATMHESGGVELDRDARREAFSNLLAQLPREQVKLLRFRYLLGLGWNEIARICGMTPVAARKEDQRLREKLRGMIEQDPRLGRLRSDEQR